MISANSDCRIKDMVTAANFKTKRRGGQGSGEEMIFRANETRETYQLISIYGSYFGS